MFALHFMKKYGITLLLLLGTVSVWAQKDKKEKKDPYTSKELWEPIPINRQLSHDKIDRLQANADEHDGNRDKEISIYGNKAGGKVLTEALLHRVDQLQIIVENLPLDHWKKVKNLMYLEEDVKQFTRDMGKGKLDPNYFQDLIANYEVFLKMQQNGEPLTPFIHQNFNKAMYGSMHMFKDDQASIEEVYLNMVRLYPDEMMKKFKEFATYKAAEDMMKYLAPRQPNLILTYATSTAAERNAVRKCDDPLVKKIVEIADQAKTPLRAITFLDDLNSGTMTIEQVNAITENNATYYKSLVMQRMKPNVLSKKVVERESKLQALEYVRTMNELHEETDVVRFKCIEPLNAREIYFLMVLCSDEIYTSSFVGSFNRMLAKMAPAKGDTFLQDLNMDKFRTFIRMSAGYNKLDDFLATMDEPNRNQLMSSFVHDIDKNTATDVEDAVDVADAFGSITDTKLLDYLLADLLKDYERTYKDNNQRGLVMYFLLHTLCSSIVYPNDTAGDLQNQLKVPPIAYVPYKNLVNDSGVVVQQVFFYGDDDGKSSFNSFLSNYKPDIWKTEKNENWIKLTSISGKPCVIYANLPLDEPKDEEAQKLLTKFLDDQNIKPSMVIHRGHSYHLSGTLKYLRPENKIIILGSCGGYHNLSTILGSSEDAHIVSSKQTGTMLVTDPIIRAVNQRILEGKDINWIEIWSELGLLMKTPALQDKFNDYVPPHKNMGALFLKAFKIQMQDNGIL